MNSELDQIDLVFTVVLELVTSCECEHVLACYD